jgi:hypothetical protein
MHMLNNLREMSEIMKHKSIKICPVPTVEDQMKYTIDNIIVNIS